MIIQLQNITGNRLGLCLILLLVIFQWSCTDIAHDGQDYQSGKLTDDQYKIVFREAQDIPNHTQFAIALIDNGQTKFYGIKRENDTIFSYENHHGIFEIGSISKVFTAILLSRFVLDQKVALDDQIQDYIDIPLQNRAEITFKQLANHTSGLPRLPSNLKLLSVDFKNPYRDYGETELRHYLSNELELERPGSYSYSNLGAGLLGYLLSEIDGTSYETLLQTYICSEYGLSQTTTIKSPGANNLVPGRNRKGEITPNWDLNVFTPAGGILSSVNDLSKFAIAQFDSTDQLLALPRMVTYQGTLQVGLGWIVKDQSGPVVWHNGATGGYSSSIQVDIEGRKAVIVLSNISAFSAKRVNIDSLSDRLMGSLL